MGKEKVSLFQKIILIITSLAIEISSSYLFFKMAHGNMAVGYISDLPAHIYISLSQKNYSILFTVIKWIVKADQSLLFLAIFEATMVTLTFIATYFFIKKFFKVGFYWNVVLSLSCLFWSKIFVPGTFSAFFYYRDITDKIIAFGLGTQPWHNITYIGMRLFMVLTLYGFVSMLDDGFKKVSVKNWLITAVSLLIATSAKPSFTISFGVVFLGFLLYHFLYGGPTVQKFKECFATGSTVFPAVAMVLYQSIILFVAGSQADNGVIISIRDSAFLQTGKKMLSTNLLLSFGFIFVVWLMNRKNKEQKSRMIFMDLMLVVALLEMMFLRETGVRELDYNFDWGVFGAGYAAYMIYLPIFITNIKENKNTNKVYTVIGFIFIIASFVSGLAYYGLQFTGIGYGI